MENSSFTVSEEEFTQQLCKPLGKYWNRAIVVFHNYCENLSLGVTELLSKAVFQGKVPEVLKALEVHFKEHLVLQDPKIRGTVRTNGVNQTQAKFVSICEMILKLKPPMM